MKLIKMKILVFQQILVLKNFEAEFKNILILLKEKKNLNINIINNIS